VCCPEVPSTRSKYGFYPELIKGVCLLPRLVLPPRTNEVVPVPEIPDLEYAYVVHSRLNGQVPGYSKKHRTVLQLLYDVVVLEYSRVLETGSVVCCCRNP
jgi:hypothetical protein